MKKMIGAVSLVLTFSGVFAQADNVGAKGCNVLLDGKSFTAMQKNDRGLGIAAEWNLPEAGLYRFTVQQPTSSIEVKILKVDGQSEVELAAAEVETLPVKLILPVGTDQNKHSFEVVCFK